MDSREVSFGSLGVRCAGRLYLPSATTERTRKVPCVVMGHGGSGTMSLGLDAYANRFADAGFAAFAFDYRGFGLSAGEPRQVISVPEQLDDWRAAVRYVRDLPEVDPDRVALWGTSLSGGHVVAVAAEDPALAAVVAQVPWMGVDLRRAGWRPDRVTARLLLAALRDAVGVRRGRPPVLLPVFGPAGTVTVLGEPGDRAVLDHLVATAPDWRNELAARSVLSLLAYRPVRQARRLTMPLLVCVADRDVLTSTRLAARAAARAPHGELRRYAGGHFDAYAGRVLEAMVLDQVTFLREHLSGRLSGRAATADRRPLTVPGVLWDTLRAERSGPAGIAERQRTRLAELVRFARERSPYYRELYRGLPPTVEDPTLLPPVTKPELMSRFDDWVTDPDVTLEGVRAFVADPSQVGALYLSRYHVFTTSGTTGEPAILLHDHDSWLVMNVVDRLRARRGLIRRTQLYALARRGYRVAALYATGGHFGAFVLVESIRRRSRWFARHVRSFSVLTPTAELVEQLNAFRPTVLSGYPSALALVAEELQAGRLHISPVMAMTAGEHVSPAQRSTIESTLGCHLLEGYAASEAPALSLACRHGRLHLNVDWYLVEPVDANMNAVPVGELSQTVLVTSLANRVQPVIRYDLGDRVRLHPERCPCGSPLPTVEVEGRTNDVLVFEPATGSRVTILPLALGTVVEETPGVHRFQAIQTAPASLAVRIEPDRGADPAAVWAAVQPRIRAFLDAQGLPSVRVDHDPEPPRADPRSGKFRQVWTSPAVPTHRL